jgi:hypothetical protein
MKWVTQVWFFASSSGNGMYQTLLYDDDTLSCDCPGWTRRNPPGGRQCKHTRAVACGSEIAAASGGLCKLIMAAGSAVPAIAVAQPPVKRQTTKPELLRSVTFNEE